MNPVIIVLILSKGLKPWAWLYSQTESVTDAGVWEHWIVNPRIEKLFVYYLGQTDFQIGTYTFNDKVKVSIYGDLWIGFQALNL